MDQELQRGLDRYTTHLEEVTKIFNAHAAIRSVPIRMDASKAISAARSGIGLSRVSPFWSRQDDSGVVHETQLTTAIDCLAELIKSNKRCGHVVGAMQSGKTTTSLALQWSGPALYALSGEPVYPFYILGNQTNHEDQTRTELNRFLAYYGELEISALEPAPGKLDGVFELSPSLNNYRGHVLRGALEDTLAVPQLQDLLHRRVGGQKSVERIAGLCRRATEGGYRPLMIIDEPQFGASDRIVMTDSGRERRTCVLARILDRIEEEVGSDRTDHWFIGLSATPFELNDLERVWEVRQALTEQYSGFNYFNGRPLDLGAEVTPPQTSGLTDFAETVGVPDLALVSLAAFSGSPRSFARHCQKVGFCGDQDAYRETVVDALRDTIYGVISSDHSDSVVGSPVGLCIRAFNNNARTEALVQRLDLDPNRVEVIEYFGPRAVGRSVKRMIARRKRHDLPFVIFVTNRARMADAFPIQVRFFMDLAQKASDLNSLLQGLLGRACGYGKKSVVVLSDESAAIVDAYVATQGGYVHKTSRHTLTLGGYRRGAPTGMLKVRVESDDSLVSEFFRQLNAEVVETMILKDRPKLSSRRSRGKPRTGPVLKIAEDLGLFEHLESPKIRVALYPTLPVGFRVARAGDQVMHGRNLERRLGYALDDEGNCRYTFRWSDREAAAQGGAAGRAKGRKDSGQHVEPTIYVEKFDPLTGDVIDDRVAPTRVGSWRAFMVTFPLVTPVREIVAAEVALPVEESPFSDWMSEEEVAARANA